MDSTLVNYLQAFRDGSEFYTHISQLIPNTGKFRIERKNSENFWKLYCDLLEKKGDTFISGLSERPREYVPILADIDISIDYVSADAVFEVFHYEWDSFEYDAIYEKKIEIENFVLNQDWDVVAKDLWKIRDKWLYLDFFDQTKWRTDYFGLSPEKFKNVIWVE